MATLPLTSPNSIFVQIASYRDSQLIPTLLDLIHHAKSPQLLRIVVCWQHAPNETIGDFWRQGIGKWRKEHADGWTIHHLSYRAAQIELIDVPHLVTQGACWARNLLQQRYRGERYTLQLDSHHRFVDAWDTLVIGMLESLRNESAKPLLTTYLPHYDPENADAQRSNAPQIMVYSSFNKEGVVLFRSQRLSDWETRDRPMRTRFYSAHFAFADGHFAETVQHDPDYFFHGEEISIAVRAFTHGYDLYSPHRVIAWHEYTRAYRVKMWHDHSNAAMARCEIEEPWHERNQRSLQRNRALLGVDGETSLADRFGKYGLGTERTLADYEAYAGISFTWRGVQPAVLDHEQPIPGAQRPDVVAWNASLQRAHNLRVCVHQIGFDKQAANPGIQSTLPAAASATVTVYDSSETALHEEAVDTDHLLQYRKGDWLDFHLYFESEFERIPTAYVVALFDEGGNLLSRVRREIDA